jgi:hypothetical protein
MRRRETEECEGMQMRKLKHLGYGLAATCVLALGSACEANAMDLIFCKVTTDTAKIDTGFADALCARAAEVLDAKPMARAALDSAIADTPADDMTTRFHVLEARIVSQHAISYRYAVGTAQEWRTDGQNRFDDMHIEISDAPLNDAALAMLADTLRRLTQ